jgi:flagellar basal-body rod protein FlgB
MNLFDTTQSALARALQGTEARQTVLAANLANANTPGYQRKDVDFQGALATALDQGRNGDQRAVESAALNPVTDTGSPLRADGSNVDVERENASIARVGLEHDALTSIVTARNAILRAAMGI